MLFKLIEYIKSVYNNSRSDKNILDDEIPDNDIYNGNPPVAVLEINILESGNIFISCGWKDEDFEIGKQFGIMLGLLNQGDLKGKIFETLYAYAQQNPDKEPFVRVILATWENISDNATMKPSEVFKNADQQV